MKPENVKSLMDVLIGDERNRMYPILGFLELEIPFHAGAELPPEVNRPSRILVAEDSLDLSRAHEDRRRRYKSKYFNLDQIPEGWTDGEFVGVIQILESYDRHRLRLLLQQFQIVSSLSPENLDTEDMISALISDASKDDLITALKRLKSLK
jgi:hypothetical protein